MRISAKTIAPLAILLASATITSCASEASEATTLEVAGSSAELRRDTDNDGHDDDDDFWYCGANYGKDKHNRNKCPAVAAIAQPPAVRVGQSTRLKGFAVDVDGPRRLKFSWTATPVLSGRIANPNSKRTSFKCLVPGKVHFTLSVTDGDCTRSAKVDVECLGAQSPRCGDGAKNGNETCDNSDPTPGNKCPSSCDDHNACTTDTLQGSAASCNALCTHALNTCKNADGCCPPGCNHDTDSDCSVDCGDGVRNGGEICDSSDPDPADKCPTSCDDGNPCTTDTISGSGASCNAVCGHTAIPGCGTTNCGDGAKNGTETCDNSAPDAADKCPVKCDDGNACTVDSTTGSASTCNLACSFRVITQCMSGDGCCPPACRHPQAGGNDSDCSGPAQLCGDGVKTGTETCDDSSLNAADKCPTLCNDGNPCTKDTASGSPSTCDVTCAAVAITTCDAATVDLCCPNGCNSNTDRDCIGVCGDGVIDVGAGETCDPPSSCPTSCDDHNVCTKDVLIGDPTKCTSACTSVPSTCVSGDGCCPAGCRAPAMGGTDQDCSVTPPDCGDGRKTATETCDDSSPNPADKCPTSCDDHQPCTVDVTQGNASTCNLRCSHTNITQCTSGPVGDGCCPAGCNGGNDGDCSIDCGNGLVEGPELCDGNCPTAASCDDGDACTIDSIEADVTIPVSPPCNTRCVHQPVETGSCPCGNGRVDPNETCDGADCTALIAACDDHNPCTIDSVSGSKLSCDVRCTHTAATTAECLCGNGVKDIGETCDNSSPNAADKCLSACVSSDACVTATLTGSAATCSVTCTHSDVVACINGDHCCPQACSGGLVTDSDCLGGGDRCEACENAPHSSNHNCSGSRQRCLAFPDAKVPNGAALCKAELDCVHTTKCANSVPTDCLCGPGVDPFDCFTGAVPFSGDCKGPIIAAAGTSVPIDLATRLFDPEFPSGAAETVIETCDAYFCFEECLAP